MSIRSQLFRASSILCLVLVVVGPVSIEAGNDDSKPTIKPISQNNRSSQSSRYGDRVQQMKSRSSSSSSSRSSSVSRTSPSRSQSTTPSRSSSSYSPSSRSSSSSSAVTRSRTSSSSSYDRSRSSSSSSYDRSRSSSSSSYNRTPSTRTPSYNRSSSSNRSSSYTRNTTPSSSSSYRRSTTPSNSTSVNRSRSSSAIDRSRSSSSSSNLSRSRSTIPSNTYTRSRTDSNSSSYDRSRGTTSNNPYVSSNERRSTSNYNSRTRTSPWVSSSINSRGQTSTGSVNRDEGRETTSSRRGDLNRGSSSTNYNRDQRSSSRSYDRKDNSSTSYDRNRGSSSYDRYSHSRNSNRDRNKHFHSGYHNRYVFDYHRYKDWSHYRKDRFLYGAYCPFYDRLYHRSYFNRRYYSPAVFSTVILSAGVSSSIYDNYDYGNYTTYNSTEPFVELYEHSRFRGESLQVFAGEAIYNLRDIRFDSYKSFNDRFSSIKVYGDVTVILYTDRDFKGEYIYLHGSHIDFSRDAYLRQFNDRISSIEVIPGIVNEADHRAGARDYLLNSHLLDASPYQPPVSSTGYQTPVVANTVAEVPVTPSPNSVIHAKPARVILYDQPNYKGNQIILTPGDVYVDLQTLSKGLAGTWNDCVSSIRVEGQTELFIYCDRDFSGDGIAIRYDVPNMAVDTNLVPFVNRISSVVVNATY